MWGKAEEDRETKDKAGKRNNVDLPRWTCSVNRCSASLVMLYAEPPLVVRPARPEETVMIVPTGDFGSGWERMKWCVME